MTSMIPTGSGTVELADAAATGSHPAIESCDGIRSGDRIEARRGACSTSQRASLS
jgi:hypothetical protein